MWIRFLYAQKNKTVDIYLLGLYNECKEKLSLTMNVVTANSVFNQYEIWALMQQGIERIAHFVS